MRKPGCRPADFPPLTFQPSSEIASNRSGPRTSSLVESGRRPIRLANQLESGTSSIVFTLRRADVVPLPERRERVGDEIVPVRVLDRHDLRRVERHVVVGGDRIVGIERRRLRRQRLDRQHEREKRREPAERGAGDLEDIAEHNIEMLAVAAAESGVDPENRAVVGVESKAEAVCIFEVLEVEIRATQCDLAGVVEQRRVQARPDFKAVLGLRQNRVRSAKPVVAEPAQRIVPAERRHQVERDARP